jgi:hypothetical protein
MVGEKYPKMGNNPQLTNIIWFAEMQRTGIAHYPGWKSEGRKRVSRKGAKEERKGRKEKNLTARIAKET